jgi:carbamate kinase
MADKVAVVAFGGNALVLTNEHNTIDDQFANVVATAPHLVDMIEDGWKLVVTHGNGPQVGFIMRRSELAVEEVSPVPMDYVVADTQGAIGYMFNKALANELRRRGLERPVVTVVTQTLVDPADPAFDHPTKPIGAFMDQATAEAAVAARGWTIAEDAGRGWRRTVASPLPQEIVEIDTIAELLRQGTVVIACGGGGIPVTRDSDGDLVGLEAVIDKDLASALLAERLGADAFVVPTGVEKVAINFGTPEQQWLDTLTVAQATEYAESGQFGEGSMRPKVESLVGFVNSNPTGIGIVTDPANIGRALRGETGTRIQA